MIIIPGPNVYFYQTLGTSNVLKESSIPPDTTYVSDMFNWHYFSSAFTASLSYTAKSVKLYALKVGSPVVNYTTYLYSDNAGKPNTVLSNGTFSTNAGSTAPLPFSTWEFTGGNTTITSGSIYHIVVNVDVYPDINNRVSWINVLANGYNMWHSDDGTNWPTPDTFNTLGGFEIWGS